MKLIPSSLISLRSTFGKSFSAAVCIGFLTMSAQAQLLLTSFETDQGFVVGGSPNNGATDWQGSTTGSGAYQFISDEHVYDGTQSLAMRNGNGISQYYFTRTKDGEFLHSLNSLSYSFYFTHQNASFNPETPNADIARFEMYFNSNDQNLGYRAFMELHYLGADDAFAVRFGSSASSIDNLLAFTAANMGDRTVLSDSNLSLADWNQVTVTLDLGSGNLLVAINGTNLSSPVELNPLAFNADSRVNALRFTTPPGGAGTTYYDHVTMQIPEPSLSLLAVVGIGVLIARRRTRSC